MKKYLNARLTHEEAMCAADALEYMAEHECQRFNDMWLLTVANALRKSDTITISGPPLPMEDAIAEQSLLQSLAA